MQYHTDEKCMCIINIYISQKRSLIDFSLVWLYSGFNYFLSLSPNTPAPDAPIAVKSKPRVIGSAVLGLFDAFVTVVLSAVLLSAFYPDGFSEGVTGSLSGLSPGLSGFVVSPVAGTIVSS